MIHPGLVSVTFRALAPAQVVALVRQGGLRGIEWGGDVHVPPGNATRAREVRELTLEAGLSVAAYGSYYRAGQSEADGVPFDHVLETAIELGAPTIRVWAGAIASEAADEAFRARVAADLRRVAALAGAARTSVSLEFHNGTLTDTADSTRRLLDEVSHPNLFTYWQPPLERDTADCMADLRSLLPRVTNVHVFHWRPGSTDRLPLADGEARWRDFLDIAAGAPGDRYAMLEFVERDSPECFLRDAATLKSWLTPSGRG